MPRLRVIAAAMVIAVPYTASPAAPVAGQPAARGVDPLTWSTGDSAAGPRDRAAESRRRAPPVRAAARPATATADPAGGATPSTARIVASLGDSGIPEVALRAYRRAELALATGDPGCGVTWSLLAAIGRVESNHGRFGGVRLREDGYGTGPIRGIPLDGRPGVALILDSDGGTLDGDRDYDRAVGPMQFIPSTWRSVAADGNGDGRSDPDNLFDAALGAAVHLCAGPADLRDPPQRAAAVWRYNHSDHYVGVVLALAVAYEQGLPAPLPELGPAPPPPPTIETPSLPPASVGWPPGLGGPASVAELPAPPTEPTTTTEPPPATAAECPPPAETTTTTEAQTSTTTSSTTTTTIITTPAPDAECPPTSTTSTTATTSTTSTTATTSTTSTTSPEPATTVSTGPEG